MRTSTHRSRSKTLRIRSFRMWMLALFTSTVAFLNSAQAQNVTVSGAATGNGSYLTLGAAFTAINAGAQTGTAITVSIDASTAEPGPAILNTSDWASVAIYPSVTGLTVSG